MSDEVLFHHGTTMVRRAPCSRRGDVLSIEYRDGGEGQRLEITPGQVEWEEPSARVHRAVKVGRQAYEQFTVFLLDRAYAVAQPTEE